MRHFTGAMRRMVLVVLFILMPFHYSVSADEHPFNFYIDEEVIIHPAETIDLRIAYHNIANDERHFKIELNQSDSDITVSNLEINYTRVASGRLGEVNLNLTADEISPYGVKNISFDITCLEDVNYRLTHQLSVIISRWSNLNFGANDGSTFIVQQNVNTSLAVNITNTAGYMDNVTISMETDSNWDYGFVGDFDGDKNLEIQLENDSDEFIYFFIQTPLILNGAPLAGTGPTFTLTAQSELDKRIETWTFGLKMQTFHNISIDHAENDLQLDPGDDGRLQVTVRNNGNIDTYLDTTLSIGGSEDADRIEVNGWTVAIFNAFDLIPLSPNESRTLEIGFDSPNVPNSELDITLIAQPLNFPQRAESITLSSKIQLSRSASLSINDLACPMVDVNEVCQSMVTIQNSGNFFDQFKLSLVNESGMNFEITSDYTGLTKGEISNQIPLNISTLENAIGFQEGSVTLLLENLEGEILDQLVVSSTTAPYVNWIWEDSARDVNNGRLEVVMTLRNEGNIIDGLIVKMSSSYYTDMSFIPPTEAIFEDTNGNIRSFEIIDIPVGANFTFRGWADLPDDQYSSDDFYLNITANSRLAEDNPFIYSANSSFSAAEKEAGSEGSVIDDFSSGISYALKTIWAWKLVLLAILASGVMINKSLRDRRVRLEKIRLENPVTNPDKNNEDWMAEFSRKRQNPPEIVQSPQIPSDAFTGMFKASSKPSEPALEPVDGRLVTAASTVLDHHEINSIKGQIESLSESISKGDISQPHNANVMLPDDIVPITDRTVPKPRDEIPSMFDLDDLDL